MRRSHAIALIAGTLLLSSCAVDCVTGTGAPVVRTLQVPAFTGILVDGALDVHVTRGSTASVTVEGQAELVDLVATEVRNGTWRIYTSKCYSTDAQFVVRIQVPQMDRIELKGSGQVRADSVLSGPKAFLLVKGSGDITVNELHVKQLMVSLRGSGDIAVSGTAERFDAELEGSGDIQAQDLAAAQAEIVVQGSGDATITAIKDLDASILGSGNIRYRGQPKVISRIEGSGMVTPIQ